MIDDISFLPQPIGPIGPSSAGQAGAAKKPQGPSFADILGKKQLELKLSAHAQARLTSRQIQFNDQDWAKINDAVDRAAAKGSRESLVLTDKAALVVSVKNRTVITAVDPSSLKENVFTNIDSAVIV